MKKWIIGLLMAIMTVSVYAQEGLKGSWFTKESQMGVTIACTETYLDEQRGTVRDSVSIVINFSMLGSKCTGQVAITTEGQFTYDGSQIAIQWNPNSMKVETIQPIVATVGGKEDPSIAKMFEDIIAETCKESETSIGKEDIYTNVKVNAKKLSYQSPDKDGKMETTKLTRVK